MRFVRLYHDPNVAPGARIRVEHDGAGAFCVSDENVLPEKTLDPDANHVVVLGCVELDHASALWLRDAMIALCDHLDREQTFAAMSKGK